MANFCWTTLSVQNLEASLDFYQNVVGLQVSERMMPGESVEIVFLGKGETKLELIQHPDYLPVDSAQGIFLGFEVASLERQMEFVKTQGIEITGGPYQPSPHVKFFFVQDPNGVTVQFVEKI